MSNVIGGSTEGEVEKRSRKKILGLQEVLLQALFGISSGRLETTFL